MFTPEMLQALGIDAEEIQQQVVENVSSQLLEQIRRDAAEKVSLTVDRVVGEKVTEWVTNMLNRPYQPISTWGEPKGPPTTIQNVIEDNAANFMKESVNREGKAYDGYGDKQPRYMWAARKVAEEAMEKTLKPELNKLILDMRNQIVSGMSTVVADVINRNFTGR